jgi:hypothetical protein
MTGTIKIIPLKTHVIMSTADIVQINHVDEEGNVVTVLVSKIDARAIIKRITEITQEEDNAQSV